MILLELFLTFFKIGAFTFGGGYAMLPFIQKEVIAHAWLTEEELINFIAVSESTPGPFAVNVSTYVGTETAGIPGALCATLGVILPSFLIILIVAHCYAKFSKSRIVNGCMTGLRPAVIGMIAAAVLSTGKTVFFPKGTGFDLATLTGISFIGCAVIFAVMLFLALKKKHPIMIIALSALAGIGIGYLKSYIG